MDVVLGWVSHGGLILGIGNEFRSDDGVGPYVARRLVERNLAGFEVSALRGDAAELMEAWDGRDAVVVIDAAQSGGVPGALHAFDAHSLDIPKHWFAGSTHSFGLEQAIELSRALGRLPERLMILGIEGRTFEPGRGLSPEVKRAADTLVDRLEAETLADAEPHSRKERGFDVGRLRIVK
jgi:hydrogenase maturation protease